MTELGRREGLVGRWYHSHEEDRGGTEVYRRAEYSFPPSRGRRGFELNADGSATALAIGADDRRLRVAARWQLTTEGSLLVEAPPESGLPPVLEILAVEKDRLVVRIPGSPRPDTSP
jgi:hypothetical protein